MFKILKNWAFHLKSQLLVLYFAYRDKRVPIIPKILAILVVAYACSPIDLIPDFIPVLGYIDDIILVPVGIYLVLKLIPLEVLEDCREKVRKLPLKKPKNWITGAIFILIWIAIVVWIIDIIIN